MTKYSDIEIQTAKNLIDRGYNWIIRTNSGKLYVHASKLRKINGFWWPEKPGQVSEYVCSYVPIFESISSDDKEPTRLASIAYPPILDEVEKRYLRGVIRPLKVDNLYIMKHPETLRDDLEEIIIGYNSDLLGGRDWFRLPPFKAGTMYTGMEPDRKYSLEELGL